MATQDLSNGGLLSSDADEQARKLLLIQTEFPLGVAPYNRGRLISFGFWGGIVGAGIAGAVNLRRSNQARDIPALLLITLAVLLVDQIVLSMVIDRLVLSGAALDQNGILLPEIIVNTIFGVCFAIWIGGRQGAISDRWLELAGAPRLKDQGGCLTAVGWVVIGFVVAAAVSFAVYPIIGQATLKLTYPPQHFSGQGVDVTLPSGWAAVAPEKIKLNCQSADVHCVVVAQDGWSGSTAILFTTSGQGVTAESFASALATEIHRQTPSAPEFNPQPFSAPALTRRAAFTFTGHLNNVTFWITTIDNDGTVIDFTLNCADSFNIPCEDIRNQIVSTLTFSTPPATPDSSVIR
ncbi:MAG: hypothetical protein ABI835_16010 [Chloroflexota bacterium]